MITRDLVKPNRYQDSVTLMGVAIQLRGLPGVEDASLMMGTVPNKELLSEAGLLTADGDAAGPNDLIVALRGDEAALAKAAEQVEPLLEAAGAGGTGTIAGPQVPHTLGAGLAALPDANLVLISTPGLYAAPEARKALQAGRHVMIFSDNVPVADEQALKAMAAQRGLLLMGPDCGTAILGGVPLGFANAVRRGSIGVVGASGTGMQEITTLVDRYGGGISAAIGTGSRDLSAAVGGVMTIMGLRALLADPQTAVVVVVSKPPHPDVAARVAEAASAATKPVVFAFLGADREHRLLNRGNSKLVHAATLEDAARQAVALAGGTVPEAVAPDPAVISAAAQGRTPEKRYVRGLFSGGTFCYEAMLLLQPILGGIYSNTPLAPEWALPDAHHSTGHTCLDLGADEFTVGRPHPMIDLTARAERLVAEAEDPTVAVLLLDVVLGYGAHPDPAGGLGPAIREARARAGGRPLAVVASICGTDADPQRLSEQRNTLRAAGVILAPSNAAAARLAAAIASATP
ncbi:MAG TPA: acyl-CoA synthetase FdrA [Chloroflexia bacterium]|nr:acyl-CoA synthetase FdrA [Chloroflexia bacterium]